MIFFGCLGLQDTKKNIKYTFLNKKIKQKSLRESSLS